MIIEQIKAWTGVVKVVTWIKGLFKKEVLPRQDVSNSTGVVNVSDNSASTININNFADRHRGQVPASLAQPKITIKQIAFSGSLGENCYTFEVKNLGGDIMTPTFKANGQTTESTSRLPRGGMYRFKVSNISSTGVLLFQIEGFDVNGDEISLHYYATHRAGKFQIES